MPVAHTNRQYTEPGGSPLPVGPQTVPHGAELRQWEVRRRGGQSPFAERRLRQRRRLQPQRLGEDEANEGDSLRQSTQELLGCSGVADEDDAGDDDAAGRAFQSGDDDVDCRDEGF